jgi:hypothetical protein
MLVRYKRNVWKLVEVSDVTGLAIIESGGQMLIVCRNSIKEVKKRVN